MGFPDLFAGGAVFTGTVQQTVGTVAGQFYDLSFYIDNTSGTDNNDLTVSFNGATLMTGPVALAAGYQLFSFQNLIATSASASLVFTLGSGDGEVRLDDVAVIDAVAAGVPEMNGCAAVFPTLSILLLLAISSSRRSRSGLLGIERGI